MIAAQSHSWSSELERCGYAVVERLIGPVLLDGLRREVDELLASSSHRGGVRNVMRTSEALRDLAETGPPAELAREVLRPRSRPTKLTIFDKTAAANWKVPWHQDLTISVRERRDVPGFGPWSVKDGVPHVQPPDVVLRSLLAIRLHLDDTPRSNGALRVLAGSHRFGRLTDEQVADLRSRVPETVCAIDAGGAMLMSPLLLHASSPAETATRRRVLHFEYSAAALPGGLEWD